MDDIGIGHFFRQDRERRFKNGGPLLTILLNELSHPFLLHRTLDSLMKTHLRAVGRELVVARRTGNVARRHIQRREVGTEQQFTVITGI